VKSTVETLGPTRAKLTVEVPFEELEPSLTAAYQQIARQINVPGFRRGKVPPAVIDRQVGRGAVLDQAVNDVVPKKYIEALQANDLQPLAQPEIDVTKFADKDALEFTAEVDIRPEISVPDFAGIHAQVDDVQVTDADVEEQLDALRDRFATLADVERPAADGDFVVIDLVAVNDGQAVSGAEVSGMSYRVGRGGMLDGLDEALAGLAAGDSATFTSQLVGGELSGQDVDVTVTVSQVQEQELLEVDDDFAQQTSEFDTVDELTDDVRERLGRLRRLEQAAAARDVVLEALLATVEVPVPESLVVDEMNARRKSMEQQLGHVGLTLTGYLEDEGQTIEEFEADLRRRVEDSVAAQFLLDEIARSEDFSIEQEELTQHMVRKAQQSGEDPQQFVQHMIQHNHIPELIAEVRRSKALAAVVEAAVVTDRSGNRVELAGLQPDGTVTDGEPDSDTSTTEG
jgi:trigger factor